MCGVALVSPPDPSALRGALEALRDRGPDSAGAVHLEFASLGVTRLAITGFERGDQPFVSPSGSGWVGFNGAIYNAWDLARRCSLDLSSGNNGQVIWHLYERFGLEFASLLEGMYAICILDGARSRWVVAVDPLGVKPLYMALSESRSFAASTLQALPTAARRTTFRVPPRTVWSSTGEVVRTRLRPAVDRSLGELLADSVAEQIPSEVPWGCLLSGGLDSSTLAALAARCRGTVRTFTSGLPGSPDLRAAVEVAAVLGTDHHEEPIRREELPALLEAVVRATASPDPITVLAGIGTYAAARAAARRGVKVLLTGEGADELLTGYEEYARMPEEDVEACLVHDQLDLGASECLRLDRCTMAHRVEARVPFLSSSLIHRAPALPPAAKLDRSGGRPVHKAALRRFAATLLPARIAVRPKAGFPDGTGLTGAVRSLAYRVVDPGEAAAMAETAEAGAYFEVQRALGVDDRVSALTWRTWRHDLSHLAESWSEMAHRGLVRRLFREGPYRPEIPGLAPWGRRPIPEPLDEAVP